MISIVNLYFNYWNQHSTKDLRNLFDNSVVLEDWENKFVGVEEVIQENKNIFENFPNINATIIDLGISDKIAYAKIKVFLDSKNEIDVVDTFDFKENKITGIKAYKG